MLMPTVRFRIVLSIWPTQVYCFICLIYVIECIVGFISFHGSVPPGFICPFSRSSCRGQKIGKLVLYLLLHSSWTNLLIWLVLRLSLLKTQKRWMLSTLFCLWLLVVRLTFSVSLIQVCAALVQLIEVNPSFLEVYACFAS